MAKNGFDMPPLYAKSGIKYSWDKKQHGGDTTTSPMLFGVSRSRKKIPFVGVVMPTIGLFSWNKNFWHVLAFYAKVWYDFLVIKKRDWRQSVSQLQLNSIEFMLQQTQIHCSMNFIENPNLLLIFFTLSIKKSPWRVKNYLKINHKLSQVWFGIVVAPSFAFVNERSFFHDYK